MEKNELSNSNISNFLPAAMQALKGFNLDAFKDIKGVDKFLPMPLSEIPINLGDIAASLKTQPFFDFNHVVEISKNLKSLDSTHQNQIESILTSKEAQISSNLMQDILKTLSAKKNQMEASEDETNSDDSESMSDEMSVNFSASKRDGSNLLDNIKENLDIIMKGDGMKKKNAKKRWWTPEEVKIQLNLPLIL